MLKPVFQIKKERETVNYGLFVIEPLEQGYGHTLGNALRRVLLASLPGAAITEVKIDKVRHKFSTLKGLKEDIIELLLNLKQIRLKYSGQKPIKLHLEKSGPGEVKAGDIKASGEVEIVNKELVLGHLADKKSKLKIQMTVERGYGYRPVEEREVEKMGLIPLDAIFSPVQRVNYKVEATRVGRRTDLDRLILEIFTDGTIEPYQALKRSAQILIDFFGQIVNPKEVPAEKEKKEIPREVLDLTVEEIDLPTRIANALGRGGLKTVSDLVATSEADLIKIKNLGDKSIEIIKAALASKNLALKGTKK